MDYLIINQAQIQQQVKDCILIQIQNKQADTQDEIRDLIQSISLNDLMQQFRLAPYTQYSTKLIHNDIVLIKVLVTDILENDFYVAAQLDKGEQNLFPFARSWNTNIEQNINDQDQLVFADRYNVIGNILSPDSQYNVIERVQLHFYQPQTPPIFSVQHLVGIVDIEAEDTPHIHVLGVYSRVLEQPTLLGSYDILMKQIQQVVHDDICAQWILLALLSSIHYREGDDLGGRLILNITNAGSLVPQKLAQLFKPSSVVTLTLDTLNKQRMIPGRNLDSYRIESGLINLPINEPSLYLIDECHLEQGALNEQGYHNLQMLKSCIETSVLKIDFNYSETIIQADYQAIIFSIGKSMLPYDVMVVLDQEESKVIIEEPHNPYQISSIIRAVREKSFIVQIPEELKSKIADTYTAERVKDNVTINPKILSIWISIMKIYCAFEEQLQAREIYFLRAINFWKRTVERNIKQ